MINKISRYLNNEEGFTLAVILAVTLFLSALAVDIASLAASNLRLTTHDAKSLTALNVAESGVNYYLWHLSHNTTDYCDGAASCTGSGPFGPYVHNYYDTAGKLLGTYTLTITPPTNGSTVTTVQSVGQVAGLQGSRTILAQLGIPSFASYGLLTGTEVWFGSSESTSGPVHSNVGVHMDGTNNGPVTAARATYTPTSSFGGNGVTVHNGVWGTGGPTAQWQYPVPTVQFSNVTADLQALKTKAQSSGVYLAALGNFNAKKGYYLNLKNNGTIDIYTVSNETNGGITKSFVRNQSAPSNGIFYVEDNVWVDGTYNGRMTIASGRFPSNSGTDTTIKIAGNILYTAKDGTVALGMIAQNNVELVTWLPNANLEIDGALLAQNGHVWATSSEPVFNKTLTVYGSIESYSYWTWTWVNGNNTVAGFATTVTTFDTNLKYAPPPSFPITGTYSILNWRELLYVP